MFGNLSQLYTILYYTILLNQFITGITIIVGDKNKIIS